VIHKTDICAFHEHTGLAPSASASRCRPTFPAAQRCCAARTCSATHFRHRGCTRSAGAHCALPVCCNRHKTGETMAVDYDSLRRADTEDDDAVSTEQLSVRVVRKQRAGTTPG
jgi:hypothetical protein